MSARRLLAWLWPLLLATAPVAAQDRGAQAQLDAVRQALLEAALSGAVRVQSQAWVDAGGRLHESARYTAEVRLRRVQLLGGALALDGIAPPQVQVQADPAPQGLPTASCQPRARGWRQALLLDGPWPAAARQRLLQAAQASRHWMAQAPAPLPRSAYEAALLGQGAPAAGWRLRWDEGPGAPALELAGDDGTRERLALPEAGAGLPAAVVGRLDALAACLPVWFTVQGGPAQPHLRESQRHGLRAGDRLLLVPRAALDGGWLAPGLLEGLVLVQAGEPREDGTPLRLLAGGGLQAGTDWVAVPL